MKVRSTLPRWILVSCVLGITILGGIKWATWSLQHRFDLSNKPPGEVFARIFRAPVPPGVYNMQVAGEAHLSGVVWMRFQSNEIDEVLRALKRSPHVGIEPTDGAGTLFSSEAVEGDYARAVDWGQALRIQKPQFYRFPKQPSGTGWFGFLVVDRTHNVVYAYGELL